MQVETETITVKTDATETLVQITGKIQDVLADASIEEGVCAVMSQHTTAGLLINEPEEGLRRDIIDNLDRLFPKDGSYKHNTRMDDNAHAHLSQIAVSPDHVIPVADGRLQLGTWQEIMLVERDGPRQRTVTVTVLGS